MVTLRAPLRQNVAGAAFPNPPLALVNEIQSQTGRACFHFPHLALFLSGPAAPLYTHFYLPARSRLLHQQLNPRIQPPPTITPSGVHGSVCAHAKCWCVHKSTAKYSCYEGVCVCECMCTGCTLMGAFVFAGVPLLITLHCGDTNLSARCTVRTYVLFGDKKPDPHKVRL